ncbi:WD repeat-containing protein 46 [Crotalus tigris]|uniref:WD repeat-containing protein 46 n=1 Tax=Crotalus tigris TaxID=88082 RepID=UPI00192F8B4B|nr:WD repeat-containing protein 46 [Crotalus tigris]
MAGGETGGAAGEAAAAARGAAAPPTRRKAGRRQRRYWDGEPDPAEGERVVPPKAKKGQRPRRTKPAGKKQISGKADPFPGAADPVPPERVQKFQRGAPQQLEAVSSERLKHRLASQEEKARTAARQAARMELLLLEEPGFLEGDEEEDTCTITQADIAAAVDLAAGAKHFELRLDRFGPYRLSYTRNGRHLLLGGRRGHVAALDWHTKALMCEMNVMETVTDLTWLHTEAMFAVAQRKWLYVYDNQGVELNCLKRFHGVQRMEFLPYHFLLATASESGFLQYLDISVGKEVATICTKAGRLAVMAHNPSNAIIHLGHSNGTVTLWSPSAKAPLVRLLCHQGAVRAVAVDPSGSYMATSGLDHKLHIYDLRAYRRLHSMLLPCGAGQLDFSQRGLLGAACQEVVQVYKDISSRPSQKPYLCHGLPGPSHGLRFCPFEDVLGVGHEKGFASLLVPGAGEPNFDALENNPFRSRRQRQEWEVKAFLEKIPSELISLDPTELGRVDPISLDQQHKERAERLGFDPEAKAPFSPRRRLKGRDSAGSRLKRTKKVAAEEERALIRKSLAAKAETKQLVTPKAAAPAARRSALDRFWK